MKRILGLLAGILLCVWMIGLYDSRQLRVVKWEIYIPDLPEELEDFTILQVSDLHDCAYGKDGRGLMELMEDMEWDLLAVTGDLFDRHHPKRYENSLAFIDYAAERSEVWFVEGNHEQLLPKYEESYREELVKRGVRILDNTSVTMETNGHTWTLGGVKDRASEEELEEALTGEGFKLLLAHRPEDIDRYAAAGADLVLSGHAHGGQWRFFGQGLYAPGQGLLPKYTEGIYEQGDTILYVTTGAGSHDRWLPRFFNPPRIDLLTLKKA